MKRLAWLLETLRHRADVLVCEWDSDGSGVPDTCWTSADPGRTGPHDLTCTAYRLRGRGWRVYWNAAEEDTA